MYHRVNGWPGMRAAPRDARGLRYLLGRIDSVVVIQWPVWKGHVKAALSGVLPFQTHLIMLVSVSTEACARSQIAWAGISKRLIVKLEKKMGTFFRGSYSKAISTPLLHPPPPPNTHIHTPSPSSMGLTFVLLPHKMHEKHWAFPLGSSDIAVFAGTVLPS